MRQTYLMDNGVTPRLIRPSAELCWR